MLLAFVSLAFSATGYADVTGSSSTSFDPFSPFPLGISWYIQGGKEIMVHYYRISDRYFVSPLYQVLRLLNNVLKLKTVR